MLLKEAGKLFKEEKYEEAYRLYKQAASRYGEEIVSYNLKICQLKIEENRQQINEDSIPNASYTAIVEKQSSKTFIENSVLNKYFDNIYVVNLKHKVTDRLKVAHHLKSHGINFEIFEATNGYIGEPLKKYEEYCKRELGDFKRYPEYSEKEKRRAKPYIESAGVVGYIYSYLKILKDAKKQGYRRIFILEDDVILSNDFEVQFNKFINNITHPSVNDQMVLQKHFQLQSIHQKYFYQML